MLEIRKGKKFLAVETRRLDKQKAPGPFWASGLYFLPRHLCKKNEVFIEYAENTIFDKAAETLFSKMIPGCPHLIRPQHCDTTWILKGVARLHPRPFLDDVAFALLL